MAVKLLVLVLFLEACLAQEVSSGEKAKGVRQKRLLFYDEEGNLVKTFKSPYTLDFLHNAEKVPFFGSFHNMFRQKTFGVPTVYMIPVSEQVIQAINNDPMYQNKLLTVPRKDLVIEPNTLCSGKRTQIAAKSCRNFLNCWDGWAFEQECPEGLLFAKEGYCDYPQNVDCSTRTNAASPVPPTSPQCNKDFEAFRSEQNCNEFYICVERSPVKFRCPADLAYNQELGVCDYAYRVNCGSLSMSHDENPTCMQAPIADQMPSVPVPKPPSAAIQGSGDVMAPSLTDSKTVVTTNSEYNTQSWSSSHTAISRQDAIRQLRLGPPNF
ncbi:chitin binding peritrophin-A domain-containing protein [Phthorimaea operculella]|nr:chitin binding peritrophin-A domain-containing protein [Phthorimaea operculella]